LHILSFKVIIVFKINSFVIVKSDKYNIRKVKRDLMKNSMLFVLEENKGDGEECPCILVKSHN